MSLISTITHSSPYFTRSNADRILVLVEPGLRVRQLPAGLDLPASPLKSDLDYLEQTLLMEKKQDRTDQIPYSF